MKSKRCGGCLLNSNVFILDDMFDTVEETFVQENIPDVEGSIAAFFLGWCGKRASEDSVDEGCEPFIQDCKLFGQDYDHLKVRIVLNNNKLTQNYSPVQPAVLRAAVH